MCICVLILQKIVVPFCPTPVKPSHTFPPLFLMSFFSLLDNFLFLVVQPLLYSSTRNYLSISCFSFSLSLQSFPKRETFSFQPFQKFPVLGNFFRMQRYEILITFKQKTNFFLKKTQKKLFFPSPTPSFVHFTPVFSSFIPTLPSSYLTSSLFSHADFQFFVYMILCKSVIPLYQYIKYIEITLFPFNDI